MGVLVQEQAVPRQLYFNFDLNDKTHTIRRMYQSGVNLKRIRRETDTCLPKIRQLCRDLGPRKQRLSPAQIQEIQLCNGSLRDVARRLGVGKSSVWFWRQKVYDAWELEDSDSDAEEPKISFETLQEPRRCPEHGPVSVWPCVRCAAIGNSEVNRVRNDRNSLR